MEEILELVLTILLAPFEPAYDKLKWKIQQIPNKNLKFLYRY